MNTEPLFLRNWSSSNSGCGGCPQPAPCQNGCELNLDFDCVIYNKWNNRATALTNLGLTNGATLRLFAETVDSKFSEVSNVPTWTLTCLRDNYTINTLKQFAESVDAELCSIKSDVTDLETGFTETTLVATDSTTIDFTTSGTAKHNITASVKVSATVGNRLAVLGDGLNVQPQTLDIDYINKRLTIIGGNTVDFSSLICGVSGYLGEFSVDPSAVNGQYWYDSVNSELKMKVNGSTRTIVLT